MLSIITPVLNGAEFLKDNIEAIQGLSIPFEHIVVDGGSTDGTLELLKNYPHVQVLHQRENTGMYGAIDQGFKAAKGDFLAYVNSDDYVVAEGFQQMYLLAKGKKNSVVYSDAILEFVETGKKRKVKGHRFASFFLKKGLMPFVQPASIYLTSVYHSYGPFKFEKYRLFGDIDFFQRLAIAGVDFSYSSGVSVRFTMRNDSLAHANRNKAKLELELLKNYSGDSLFIKIAFKLTR